MRRSRSLEEMNALYRAKAKAAAGETTKRAKLWKRIDYSIRFFVERERVQRYYATFFRFWRFCHFAPCRRARACRGDADACLKRSVDGVPRMELRQARLKLLRATPRHIGKAELKVRQKEPTEFWRRPVDPAAVEAVARKKEEREMERRFGIGVAND